MEEKQRVEDVRRTVGEELARKGLELGAIRLSVQEPFLWASGYRMPIYNDNRTFLQDPQARQLIASGFSQILEILSCDPDWIAGTATAGIPHAATLADLMRLPLCYVRSTSKGHGLGQTIEGLGRKERFQQEVVILVEDLISTGGSSLRAVGALQSAGAQVPYCLAVFSYDLTKAAEGFRSLENSCIPVPLLKYGALIALAREEGYISGEEAESLSQWREDPFGWGEARGFPRKE